MPVGDTTVGPNPKISATFFQTLWKSALLASSPVWAFFGPIGILAAMANITEFGLLALIAPFIVIGYALAIAFVAILVGLLGIGLPIAWLFGRLNVKAKLTYQWAGGIGGALLIVLWFAILAGDAGDPLPSPAAISVLFILYGSFMGAITARLWWRAHVLPTLDIRGYCH